MKTLSLSIAVLTTLIVSGCMTPSRQGHEGRVKPAENQVVVIIVPIMTSSSDYDDLPAWNDPNFLQAGVHSAYRGKILRFKSIQ